MVASWIAGLAATGRTGAEAAGRALGAAWARWLSARVRMIALSMPSASSNAMHSNCAPRCSSNRIQPGPERSSSIHAVAFTDILARSPCLDPT